LQHKEGALSWTQEVDFIFPHSQDGLDLFAVAQAGDFLAESDGLTGAAFAPEGPLGIFRCTDFVQRDVLPLEFEKTSRT
jgi:hypothetical protein